MGTINNTSGNNNGYGDYSSVTATLNAGTSKTITLVPGFTGASYKEYWTVYIDYDKNKVFDASELVTSGNGTGNVVRTFTIPASVKSGYTRMRVVMHYSSAHTNTCDTFADGEVEDYRIKINNSSTGNVALAEASTALSSNIFVVPNPVRDNNIKIVLQLAQTAPVTLRITDLLGRQLTANKISGAQTGKNEYNINYLHLNAGTYIIIAEQQNAIIARTKFVVAN